MSDTHEVWKEIAESKGLYSVSNKGRVRNNETGYILKPVDFSRGYLKVSIRNGDGAEVNRMVHRLVAMAFIPNPENKPEVNHKNGIHGDNRLENLEWVTGEENRSHAYETGLARHKDDRYSGYLYGIWKNRKNKNRIGEEFTIPELCEKYAIQTETLKYRLKKGMSVEEAVTTPLMAKGRPRKEVI